MQPVKLDFSGNGLKKKMQQKWTIDTRGGWGGAFVARDLSSHPEVGHVSSFIINTWSLSTALHFACCYLKSTPRTCSGRHHSCQLPPHPHPPFNSICFSSEECMSANDWAICLSIWLKWSRMTLHGTVSTFYCLASLMLLNEVTQSWCRSTSSLSGFQNGFQGQETGTLQGS